MRVDCENRRYRKLNPFAVSIVGSSKVPKRTKSPDASDLARYPKMTEPLVSLGESLTGVAYLERDLSFLDAQTLDLNSENRL